MHTPLTHAWQSIYPPRQCHAQGWLDVGGGHALYWEECGNPVGPAALFVHGGPGAGCTPDDRRWFDPQHWRIVLFDQRGAGRSRATDRLAANTTGHLIQDIESLRRHLQIERWLLLGGSWGATLALAYAQRHAERVSALVLRGVFTATAQELRWLYTAEGAATLHPAGWQRLTSALRMSPGADLLATLAALLHSGDPVVEQVAARAWLRWEQDLMDGEAQAPAAALVRCRTADADADADADASVRAMARIGVHFARHAFFLEEGQLVAQAGRLRGVPGVIVAGARDEVTPPAAALALQRAWPGAQLQRIDSAGHASSQPEMAAALVHVTDHFGALAYRAATGAIGAKPMRFHSPPPQRSPHGKDQLHR